MLNLERSRNGGIRMIELWRRLSLLICLFGAVLLAFAASLSPVVLVEHIDFTRNQEREGSYMGLRIPSEEAVRLRSLPSDAYIAAKTKGKLITVDGPHWAELFGAATDVAKGKSGCRTLGTTPAIRPIPGESDFFPVRRTTSRRNIKAILEESRHGISRSG